MINELKEIKRNRENQKEYLQSTASTQESKDITNGSTNKITNNNSKPGSSKALILNKLDQEIIQNYKFKISSLEGENYKLKEDLSAVQRNFEALCLKSKNDSELIKKLEDEINYIKSKFTKSEKDNSKYETEKNEIINNYHEKIEQLNKVIKNLEDKINNSSNNNIKFLEKESSMKLLIAKLEERVKNFDSELRRQKDENKKIKDEKLQVEKELAEKRASISEMESKINSQSLGISEANEKLKKENELIIKLLDETRLKLDEARNSNKDKEKQISSLTTQIESLNTKLRDAESRNENVFTEKLNSEINANQLNAKLEKMEKENLDLVNRIKEKELKWLELSRRNDDLLIKNSEFLGENSRLNAEIEKLKNQISELIKNSKNNLVHELTAQNHELNTRNTILNSEVDLLKKENKNLKNELEAKGSQQNTEKMNEERTKILLFKVLKENILNIENTNKKLMENNFEPIEKKIILMQNKIRNFAEFIFEKISNCKASAAHVSANISEEIQKREATLKQEIQKLQSENKDLIAKNNQLKLKNEELDNFNNRFKTELDTYKLLLSEEGNKQVLIKQKLENKRRKLNSQKSENSKLSSDINNLKNTIIDLEKNLENSKNNTELKSCIQQIMSANFKVALSLDSIYYMSLCRSCSEEKNLQYIRPCGHTNCAECCKNKKECIECKEFSNSNVQIENTAFNRIVSKILFINQVKNDINGLIDFIKLKLS